MVDGDLVDAAAAGNTGMQLAIANRGGLAPAVSAAIAEVGAPEACLGPGRESERRDCAALA